MIQRKPIKIPQEELSEPERFSGEWIPEDTCMFPTTLLNFNCEGCEIRNKCTCHRKGKEKVKHGRGGKK
jgi:hypothetical protein